MSKFNILIYALLCISCSAQVPNKKATYSKKNIKSKVIKLVDGHWFNGTTFEKKTVWIHEGLISFKSLGTQLDTVVDLTSKFVIPPFAEAHNHNLESAYELDKRIASYLDHGVFYVKLLSSIKKRIDPLMPNYNVPHGIDVSLAHAPLTASGGHPIAIRKTYLEKGYFKGLFNAIEDVEFHGYVCIDKEEDLINKWDSILSFSPDFIKLNLLYSEEYQKRKDDTLYFGKKGLNPKLVLPIVRKAHAEGLRVSAHVETAYDFHVAVEAGVDEIAHLPEIDNGMPIDVRDAAIAKEKGIVVVTTVSLVTKKSKQPNYQQLLDNIKLNLNTLKKANVTLAIGSDMYNDNSTRELQLLHQLDVFSNRELLKMWTANATKTIFPKRKIGKLQEGYEASFLVLDENPLNNMSSVNEHITLRVKQGVILE